MRASWRTLSAVAFGLFACARLPELESDVCGNAVIEESEDCDSFAAPGEVTTMGPILHKGIEDRLHFAGEHTCYKFAGYMEGALNSGVAIARRLAVRDGIAIDGGK